MKRKITNAAVATLKPQVKPYQVFDTALSGFSLRVHVTGAKSYLLSYRNQAGKNQTFTLGRDSEISAAQARTLAEDLRYQIRQGHDPQAEKKSARAEAKADSEKTVRAYLDGRFKPFHLRKRKSAKESIRVLETHFAFLMNMPLSTVTVADLEKWQVQLENKGRTAETVRRCRAEIEVLFKKAVADKWIETNPISDLIPVKIKSVSDSKPRFLSEDETQRLYEALRARDADARAKADSGNQWRKERGYLLKPALPEHYCDHLEPMVVLSLKTGVRRNELFSLEWQDVEPDYSAITVQAVNAKSGKPRTIPLSPLAQKTLKQWRSQTKSNRLVFPNASGQKFDNVNKSWKALLQRADITEFRWHDQRHDFASQLVIRDVSIEKVSKLLGHADITTTQRYAHLSDKSLQEAVAVLL